SYSTLSTASKTPCGASGSGAAGNGHSERRDSERLQRTERPGADSVHARLGARHQGRSDVLGDPLPRVGAFLHWLTGLRLHRHAPVARRAGENRRGPRGGTVSILAYHFVNDTLRDGRPVPSDGEWLEHDGPIAICKSGLHASRRPWHALA